MNKLFAKVLNIRKAIADSLFTRKALSSVLALTIVLTPLSPAIAVSADEIAQENEAVEEMTVETEATVQETGLDGNGRCGVLGHSMQTNERHYSFSDKRKVETVKNILNRLHTA